LSPDLGSVTADSSSTGKQDPRRARAEDVEQKEPEGLAFLMKIARLVCDEHNFDHRWRTCWSGR
jgi:hypothetical protein